MKTGSSGVTVYVLYVLFSKINILLLHSRASLFSQSIIYEFISDNLSGVNQGWYDILRLYCNACSIIVEMIMVIHNQIFLNVNNVSVEVGMVGFQPQEEEV